MTNNNFRMLVTLLILTAAAPLWAASARMEINNDWGSGFTAKIVIDNINGDADIASWEVNWVFDQTISNIWNADHSASGKANSAKNLSWNGNIPIGQSVEFGFQGAPGGITNVPQVTLVGESDGGNTGGGGNSAPTALFSVDNDNLVVDVNGAASSDPESDALTFSWEFGDGNSASGVTSRHTYSAAGTYQVTLTVSDSNLVDSISRNVTVTASAPTNTAPNANFTYSASELSVSFDASSTTDAENDTISYRWDYGDGQTGAGLAPNHSYASAGTYNVTLSASDASLTGTQTQGLTVSSNDTGGGNDIVACGVDPSTLPNDDDWLSTSGNQIVDKDGRSVWITGANWFGFNASERVFHGLWSVNLENLVAGAAERGINLIRVPIGTEITKEWKNGVFAPVNVNLFTNPGLTGKNSLEIFDQFISVAKACGVKVMLDVHHPDQNNSGHVFWGWAKDDISTSDFYNTWEWIVDRYKNDDTIVAVDLQNEPHGVARGSLGNNLVQGANEPDDDFCRRKPESEKTDYAKWDASTDAHNWRHVAQVAASKVLAINPKLLVLVEGVETHANYGVWANHNADPNNPDPCISFNWWGGNLKGVRDLEVEVPGLQNQIMYSPHDYGPLVFRQKWFYEGFNRDSLRAEVWEPNWLYIHNDGISPLLIGEWGGFLDGGDNQKWMEALRDEITDLKLHHTFWVINPNSGDTGGLLLNDWLTWDEDKYQLLLPALWRTASGKFISLDHKAVIGGTAGTGISLDQALGND